MLLLSIAYIFLFMYKCSWVDIRNICAIFYLENDEFITTPANIGTTGVTFTGTFTGGTEKIKMPI